MLTKIHARLFLLSSILILCTIQFSACSPQVNTATELPPVVLDQPTDTAPSPGPLKIADGLDREITLDEPAQRVVSLAPSNTEILFAIGAGEQVLARGEFSRLVASFPKHTLSDNALYWAGESFYSRQDYESAISFFERIVKDYPKENKSPDAMLKISLCKEELGEGAAAEETLRELIRKYPHSPASLKAVKRLKRNSQN